MIRIYKASKGQLKHREIFDEIKKKIDNGEWKEGKAIPTERELAEHFLSSRTTIRDTAPGRCIQRLAVTKISTTKGSSRPAIQDQFSCMVLNISR